MLPAAVAGMLLLQAAEWLVSGPDWVLDVLQLGVFLGVCVRLLCRKEATRDGLTGAMDYSGYARCLGEGFPEENICVFFLDVDNLKQVNDTHGHEAGDRLLRRLADSFSPLMKEGDVLYRVGGDEFVLVKRELHPEEVLSFLARWQEQLQRLNAGGGLPLTVSHGWAAGSGRDFAALVRRADDAMYQNKNDKKF